jgi:hypothetical protein
MLWTEPKCVRPVNATQDINRTETEEKQINRLIAQLIASRQSAISVQALQELVFYPTLIYRKTEPLQPILHTAFQPTHSYHLSTHLVMYQN